MIIILDYGIGNLQSIKNMLKKAGCSDALISNNPEELETADKIILPGVGHFEYCMSQLKQAPFFELLQIKALEKKTPLLGICVGHQMLFEYSEEGNCAGLGWLPGQVVHFDRSKMDENLRIPHMEWTETAVTENASLFKRVEAPRFYFVHSYHAVCPHENVAAVASYGYEFVAAVQHQNLYGVQFHPEKSHRFGMQIFQNFIAL